MYVSHQQLFQVELMVKNAALVRRGNSTVLIFLNFRFSHLFSIDFDSSGHVASASVQVTMVEKTRVARRPEGEPNFNVFYQLLAGLDNRYRRELQVGSLTQLFLLTFHNEMFSIDAQSRFAQMVLTVSWDLRA